MRYFLSTTLFVLALGLLGFSQDGSLVNYTTKDGLPSSQVYDIIQDDYGYLWFSTDKGLSRYNGYEFENYDQSDGLVDNVVFDFVKRPNGQIWCTTNTALLFYFTGIQPTFTPYKFNHVLAAKAKNKVTHSLYFSDAGDTYLAFHRNTGYLCITKYGTVRRTPIRYSREIDEIPNLYLRVLADDSQDPFFYYDLIKAKRSIISAGVSYSNGKSVGALLDEEALYFQKSGIGVYFHRKEIEWHGLKSQRASVMQKEIIASGKLSDHEFWVGFRYGGVKIYDIHGREKAHFLPEVSVTQLFIDREGNSWFSTLENGIFRRSNQGVQFVPQLAGFHVNSLGIGPSGERYIACYDGKIFERQRDGSTRIFYFDPLNVKPTHTLYDPIRRKAYFTNAKLYADKTEIHEFGNTEFFRLINNRYLAFGIFGFNLYDLKEERLIDTLYFLEKRVKDVAYFNGKLYAGTLYGLYSTRIDYPKAKCIISGVRIDALLTIGPYLVMGRSGKGLLIIDKYHRVVHDIGKSDGLSSNYISKIVAENASTLWLATNQGINRITFSKSGKEFKIQKMDIENGLLSNEVWDVLIDNDTVWVGTQLGLNFFPKHVFDGINARDNHYFLHWKSIRVNDQRIAGKREFAHDQNKFEFTIQGISFDHFNGLDYAYKLEGFDRKWNYTRNRKITYSSLPPGTYELVVRVKGKNKLWETNEIRYAFTIHSPFWQQWWFVSLCVLALGGIIYLFFKIRVLTYNKDVVREILRYILQKLRRDEPFVVLRHNGKVVKVKTAEIHFIKTSGNYLEIHTATGYHLVRSSISKFLESLPDSIEFLQVHRSYVVRIDNVQQKGKDELVVLDQRIPVGRVYLEQLKLIQL